MKWTIAMSMVCVISMGGIVGAEEQRQVTMQEPIAAPAASPAALAAQKAKQKAAAQLNGTEWVVECTPMSGEKLKKPMTDTLQFNNGKLTSTRLTKDGYMPSNYTLSVGDDGVPIWETMQTGDTGMASWRGELHGETMTGIFSHHPVEGAAQDYSFLGHPSGTVASTSAPAASTPSPAAAAPSKKPHPEQSKKKGWF